MDTCWSWSARFAPARTRERRIQRVDHRLRGVDGGRRSRALRLLLQVQEARATYGHRVAVARGGWTVRVAALDVAVAAEDVRLAGAVVDRAGRHSNTDYVCLKRQLATPKSVLWN